VKYVIYSHHHYDPITGGKPFKDAARSSSRTATRTRRLAALQRPTS
jgi:glyoxylase-like metal-dependent hydrolase (beta-lactamase superfamily II)